VEDGKLSTLSSASTGATNWDAYVTNLMALDEKDRRDKIYYLSITWEMDWDFLQANYYYNGLTDLEVNEKKIEYYLTCKKVLEKAFGYSGVFNE